MRRQGDARLRFGRSACQTQSREDETHFRAAVAVERDFGRRAQPVLPRRIVEAQKINRPSPGLGNFEERDSGHSPGFLHAAHSEQFGKEPDDSAP